VDPSPPLLGAMGSNHDYEGGCQPATRSRVSGIRELRGVEFIRPTGIVTN
jgi:hypothetical protein